MPFWPTFPVMRISFDNCPPQEVNIIGGSDTIKRGVLIYGKDTYDNFMVIEVRGWRNWHGERVLNAHLRHTTYNGVLGDYTPELALKVFAVFEEIAPQLMGYSAHEILNLARAGYHQDDNGHAYYQFPAHNP
jgi:hypothetical protein